MGESCIERMERIDAKTKIANFIVKEKQPYEFKVKYATIRSAPFAIFSRQDLLQLAIDLNVPVPEIYGTIERKEDGTLYTTKAQRTGCSMCGFGIHLEKRPHRFDLLRERNPKEWQYWMYECCTDEETGEPYGWARVLDYIGVDYL